jgi:hypothetical protein
VYDSGFKSDPKMKNYVINKQRLNVSEGFLGNNNHNNNNKLLGTFSDLPIYRFNEPSS